MNFAKIYWSRGNLKIAWEAPFTSWEFYFKIGSNINILKYYGNLLGHI